jgi:hypothetical protein
MVYMGLERGGTEETFLEEGDKRRRRTGEKKYKENVNKKIDGQKKIETGKEAQRESCYRKSTNGKVKGQKENKKRNSYRWIITEVKFGIKEMRQEEGCIERKVHIGNKWWKIMTIYSKEMKTTRRRVEDAMKENREDCILLGGDFNGEIGERGARNWEEEIGDGKRKSKDKMENVEGKRPMEWIEENGWEVLNGNK